MTTRNKREPKNGDVIFVPLNRLKKSPRNARKTPHAKVDIAALAASIEAKGLLQNLVVEPERGAKDKPTGAYLVTAGEGRRLAFLLRVTRKQIRKDEPVRCVVDLDPNAYETSLAENTVRTPMHPADQYEAFAKLHREDGMAAEDIAARFGVTAAVVKQRLRLGAVSPKLISLYRKGELNLDQLTAFAITDDHAAQERVWSELSWNKGRETILSMLSEGQVPCDDRRAVFVGAKAYKAAGGAILRDLFDAEGGGFFTDAALLNRLVREKLQAGAEKVLAEGWKWIVVEPEFDYELTGGMRRIHPQPAPLSDADQAKLDALETRYNALADSDEDSEEAAAEQDRLEAETAALSGPEEYRVEDIARAGAVVSLGHDGEPRIERGFVRPEDQHAGGDSAGEGEEAESGDQRSEEASPLSEKLIAELSSIRTSALRNALAREPDFALLAVVHALAAAVFYRHADDPSCLELHIKRVSVSTHAPRVAESSSEVEIAARHAAWEKRLPENASQLWEFVSGLTSRERMNLLAHCASLTVNAIRAPGMTEAHAEAHADVLAQAIALDMAACWQPTAAGYFSRITKEQIVEAVREGVSEQAAQGIDHLKKSEMAAAAEKLLAGTGWLPDVLRTNRAGRAVEPLAVAAE